jgi:hypothetical protein
LAHTHAVKELRELLICSRKGLIPSHTRGVRNKQELITAQALLKKLKSYLQRPRESLVRCNKKYSKGSDYFGRRFPARSSEGLLNLLKEGIG